MAIDYVDLTAIDDALKETYGEGFTNQFAEEAITWNSFPEATNKRADIGGAGYIFSVKYERQQGIGARLESELMPVALVPKYDKGKITPKYNYGAVRITGPAIEGGKGNVRAFVDTLSDQMDDIYASVVTNLNRQCHSDGFGLLATLSAASDALTTSSTTWTVTCNNDMGLMRVKEGMIVDFFQSTAIDQSSVASRVSSVNMSAKTCEMEYNDGTYKAYHPITAAQSYTIATDTVASGSYMVTSGAREATHATSNTPREITGLDGIFDDGTLIATYENIPVASFPKWKANILSNSSVNRELTMELLMQGEDLCRRNGAKGKVLMRMGSGQKRKYANLLLPDVRFNSGELRGGYEYLTFAQGSGPCEIMVDYDASPNKIFIEPEGQVKRYIMTPLGFGNIDGGLKQRAGYDEYDRFLRIYANLGTERRNNLTLISDLVEPDIWS